MPESSKCCKLPTSLLLYRDERHFRKKKEGNKGKLKALNQQTNTKKKLRKSLVVIWLCVFFNQSYGYGPSVSFVHLLPFYLVSLSLEYRSLSLFSPDCTFGWSKKTPQRVTKKRKWKTVQPWRHTQTWHWENILYYPRAIAAAAQCQFLWFYAGPIT